MQIKKKTFTLLCVMFSEAESEINIYIFVVINKKVKGNIA